MQLHQKVWTYWQVEGLCSMSCFEPRSDPPNAGDIHLDNVAGASLHVFTKVSGVIHRFTHSNGNRSGAIQLDVSPQILCRERFLELGDINWLKMPGPANGLILGERLIGIGHDLKGGSHRFTYRL